MQKQVLRKTEFTTTMMVGYGVKPNKLVEVQQELTTLGISFDKFVSFIKKNYIGGSLESWEFINLQVCLNNYIMEKVQKIIIKKHDKQASNPFYLTYNKQKDITEFADIKEGIKFLEKHDCFKNKFIRRLNGWLLK